MANISEICENTKLGREYALLGNYETSLVYYQCVSQQIQRLLTSITDSTRKHKWQQVNNTAAIHQSIPNIYYFYSNYFAKMFIGYPHNIYILITDEFDIWINKAMVSARG